MSGSDVNDEYLLNKHFISTTLLVFHLDMSGNDINNLHPLNIYAILVTFLVSN